MAWRIAREAAEVNSSHFVAITRHGHPAYLTDTEFYAVASSPRLAHERAEALIDLLNRQDLVEFLKASDK